MASSYPKHPLFSSPCLKKRPSSSHKAFKVITMFNRQAYWASTEADINIHLMKSLPTSPPPAVTEPMRHLLSVAPKTMAPALCIAACEFVGGRRDHAMDSACALRLMHVASHTHEHLPSLRPRPKPTAFPAGVELLTADAFLPLGYELVASSSNVEESDPGRLLRVIIEIADAMGPRGMVEGQWVQLRCEASGGEEEEAAGWIERVCEKKDGKLFACGAACGAILGGGSEEEVEKLRRFGICLGMMHGLLFLYGGQKKRLEVVAKDLRAQAMLELEGFEGGRREAICGLVDLCYEEVLVKMERMGDDLFCDEGMEQERMLRDGLGVF